MYELWLRGPAGDGALLLPRPLRLQYERRVHESVVAGGNLPLRLVLLDDGRVLPYLAVDCRIEVWRQGRLALDTVWLLQYWRRWFADGVWWLELQALPARALLERRIVAAVAGRRGVEQARRM
ncbi:MAG: hypothetical protein HC837_20480, partial [Chloroflexaceae bacterium]|nr:hypothetical protein [Chloroflexaceae bacterium]